MDIAVLAWGVAFATFLMWLWVRVIERRELWARVVLFTVLIIAALVLAIWWRIKLQQGF